MSLSDLVVERSLAKIDERDLQRMTDLSRVRREEFFTRNPRWRPLYTDRCLCVALCQGAALHYLNGTNGVKDLDVWTFYAEHPEAPFPHRHVRRPDFGPSHLGRHPADRQFAGRCVDFLERSIRCPLGTDPVAAIRTYLSKSRNPPLGNSRRKLWFSWSRHISVAK